MNGEWRYFRSCAFLGEPGVGNDERYEEKFHMNENININMFQILHPQIRNLQHPRGVLHLQEEGWMQWSRTHQVELECGSSDDIDNSDSLIWLEIVIQENISVSRLSKLKTIISDSSSVSFTLRNVPVAVDRRINL